MTDPYKVLGLTPDASDEDIKKAYRELARKYHPDNYVNNPLADLVEEKMKEINEAYEQIKNEREGKKNTSGSYSNTYNGEYAEIRNLIRANRLQDAETMLESVPLTERNAEWNFLKGCVLERKGWYFDAQRFFETACYIDPTNREYQNALNNIKRTATSFGGYNSSGNTGGCSACDVCSSLVLADCCCECMGGDLIRCC